MLIAGILAAAAWLLLEAAHGDSVTIDEFAHLPAGLFYLHTGHFNVYNLSPPLLRVWCALPVWWVGAEADFAAFLTDSNHWLLGYEFMQRNADRYQALFELGRVPTIGLALALIGVLFVAGRRAFGTAGGVVAAFLCAFEPNILAHGHLVTTDLGLTLFFVLAVLTYEQAVRAPAGWRLLLAGTVLGLAQLTKFTALLLYPMLALLTLLAGSNARARWRPWLVFAGCTALSIAVVNAGYLFHGSGAPLAVYELATPGLRALAAGWLGHLPLPVPADFVLGLDQQMQEAQGQYTVFFHGQLSRTGWWYYYLAAFALKTPLPVLLLLVIGTATWVADGRLRSDPLGSAALFLPPLLYVTLFATFTDINLGLRYILPVYPFVFLIGASLCRARWLRAPAARVAFFVLLATHAGSTLHTRPYYLSYFNTLAGGPANGYRWLVDSNVDWGQDLLRLREYVRRHHLRTIRLAYFGRVAPEVYGIDYELVPTELTPGVYAISATYLMGRPYYLYDHGTVYWVPQNFYARFQHIAPTDVIGHALFIFDLRDPPASGPPKAGGSAPSS